MLTLIFFYFHASVNIRNLRTSRDRRTRETNLIVPANTIGYHKLFRECKRKIRLVFFIVEKYEEYEIEHIL
jgi:hypothetical protein